MQRRHVIDLLSSTTLHWCYPLYSSTSYLSLQSPSTTTIHSTDDLKFYTPALHTQKCRLSLHSARIPPRFQSPQNLTNKNDLKNAPKENPLVFAKKRGVFLIPEKLSARTNPHPTPPPKSQGRPQKESLPFKPTRIHVLPTSNCT